ncbi:DUF2306 domain-containing protein [Arenimonas sp.]|uniref:DUF2306 domain-containing protein n=1 Tax=Arenimonas sp. TaxID=1872635 RepID=UPI002E3009BD|nr:DUF2306 domain-containing protein [Arenimonas sp.]HEX4855139.1 DUF2306 domain-containing protein [Arenimonas sp.]
MTSTPRSPPLAYSKALVLTVLFAAGAFYLAAELVSAVVRDRSAEPGWRTALLMLHLTVTLPILFLPPFQFSRRLRARFPAWHRRAGQLFLGGSLVAASTALPLAMTQEGEGRGVPTGVFAVLWFGFAAAAWWCARRRAFVLHEQFVARTYAVAVAFIIIRLLRDTQEWLLPFITMIEVRDVTRDWLCFVLPLFAVEIAFAWWPALRQAAAKRPG